jgi:23S rRNA pseudouridine1911/1915/1917 synthase
VSAAGHSITYTVTASDAGATLLELGVRLAGAAGERCVRRGGLWVDGRRVVAPEERPAAGATISLRLPPPGGYPEVTIGPAQIAYEDPWLIALHKAPGWYVGATPWDAEGNALAALGRFLAARDGAAPPLHLAHQLDRDTSGVLLLTRDPAANAPLQAAFAGGTVAKRYSCLCAGVPAWSELELRTGHGRAAGGRWRIYPLDEVGRELPAGGGRVREARSSFVVERALRGAALLGVELHTGRTHQIRLHAAHAGYPLLGDARYGGRAEYLGRPLAGHMLHAARLSLVHPVTGGALEIVSPEPRLFAELVAAGRG